MSVINVLSTFRVVESLESVLNSYNVEMWRKNPMPLDGLKYFFLLPFSYLNIQYALPH